MPSTRDTSKLTTLSATPVTVSKTDTTLTSGSLAAGLTQSGGTRSNTGVAPPGGVLLPVGVYNVFCLPSSFNVLPASPPLRGRVVVEQLTTGQIRESWVMFSTYLAPSPGNSVWIVPAGPTTAQTQRALYTETLSGPNASGAICASWQLTDPRATPGGAVRQIDAGTVEIIASTPTGPQRVGQVRVIAPTGFTGQWTTTAVNDGRSVWGEEWAVLLASPPASAWRLQHVPAASAPQIQAWVNSVNVVVETWSVIYNSVAV
ncbi:hypothetical protein L6R49_18900 [Myxococcota bacterium]|nr:hypothetical protein [Myxococcota bacterium]